MTKAPIRSKRSLLWRVALSLIACAHFATPVKAQGTLNIALTEQFAFTACSTTSGICGTPLIGGLLYFYQIGTVATPQNSYQDTGLSILNPWPLTLDANGRVPMFYLANGSVHVRLTDANGVVQFDYPSMLVVGPSGGSGGGGAVDPTTVLSTGDIKYRATGEFLTGWVKLNGQTLGSATSGATGYANAAAQNLFVYLWTNFNNTVCPVSGGRGASGLADFSANKTIGLLDLRGSIPMGTDDMGGSAAGRLISGVPINTAGGAFTGANAPGTSVGLDLSTIAQANLPAVSPTFTGTQATWNTNQGAVPFNATGIGGGGGSAFVGGTDGVLTTTVTPAGTISALGSGTGFSTVPFALLGSYYIKL